MSSDELQDLDGDSLLHSLLLVSKHFGINTNAESLTASLPLVDDKLTPELFVRAAQRVGLVVKLVKRKLDKISPLVLPVVINLQNNQSAVLLSIKGKNATLYLQEAEGKVKVPLKDLEDKYTGNLFLISKEHDFDERSPELLNIRSRHWFWGTLIRSWRIYRDVLLASFMVNMFALAGPLFIMNVYDRVVPNKAIETLWVLSTGLIVIYLFDFVIKMLRAYFVDIAGKKSDLLLSSTIFEKVMGMRMADRPKSVGGFANNLKDFDTIRDFIASATITTLIDIPFAILFIIVIYYFAGSLAYIPIISVGLVIFYSLIIQPLLRGYVDKTMRATSQKHANLIEGLSSLETVKTLGLQGSMQRKWESITGYIAEWNIKSRLIANSSMIFSQLVQQGTTIAIVIAGVYAISEGTLSLGGLIAAVMITNRIAGPMTQASSIFTKYYHAKAALRTLDGIMQQDDERKASTKYIQHKNFDGSVSFDKVNFTYPGEQKSALTDLSFEINPGDHLAILGPVGSGKSSILKLLLKLYDADSGEIRIDDLDINQIDPFELRKNISYVNQSPILFYGTLRENIICSKPLATDEEILSVAKMSGLSRFVKNHPLGFDMNVGEGGERLSNGQRQSVAIARALLSDSRFVLLDEPTSAIDNAIEKVLKESLSSFTKGKTLILVTHRKSLLDLVEKILVVSNGNLVNFGSKEQILKAGQEGGTDA
jgi:ATP-binding cassette subfamily C protein LapB